MDLWAGTRSEAVRAAARLDGEGRHTDAIRALSVAATSGDLAAKAAVGARILIGDRAPLLPEQGARLILEAADAGGAEAAALAAVLAAIGAFRPRSWPDALRLLAQAAELGLDPARRQLALLAAEARGAALEDDAEPPQGTGGWTRLAAGLDLERLLGPRPAVVLSEDPRIRLYRAFASPGLCRWAIDRARGRLTRAMVYNAETHRNEVNPVRTNSAAAFNLVETDLVLTVLQARMAASAGVDQAQLESPAVLHYEPGEEIREHFDFVDPALPDYRLQIARDGQRVMTFLVYLNDDYDAGRTEFPRAGVSHKGAQGDGLCFANALASGEADVRTVHAGRPPAGAAKWIISQFVRNRPVVPGAGPPS